MEKTNCKVIGDLLPLYLDGVCSEETTEMVEEHLNGCEECKKNLEYMKSDIFISEERDANVIKQVKKRIRIEKLVVTLIGIFVAVSLLLVGGIRLLTTQVIMNDELTKDNLKIEETEDGEVWLVRNGYAVDVQHVIPNRYTPEGEVIFEAEGEGFREGADDSHVVLKLMLYESKVQRLSHKIFGENSILEEKNLLFDIDEKENFEKIVVESKDGEVVLWEKNK